MHAGLAGLAICRPQRLSSQQDREGSQTLGGNCLRYACHAPSLRNDATCTAVTSSQGCIPAGQQTWQEANECNGPASDLCEKGIKTVARHLAVSSTGERWSPCGYEWASWQCGTGHSREQCRGHQPRRGWQAGHGPGRTWWGADTPVSCQCGDAAAGRHQPKRVVLEQPGKHCRFVILSLGLASVFMMSSQLPTVSPALGQGPSDKLLDTCNGRTVSQR